MSDESADMTPGSGTAAQSSEEEALYSISDVASKLYRWRKAHNLILEQASERIGVSAATLSRLERQRDADKAATAPFVPDIRTLAAVTRWLGIPLARVEGMDPSEQSVPSQDINESVPEIVAAHLRADRNLDDEAAVALSNMFRMAYEQFSRLKQKPSEQNSETEQRSREVHDG